MKKAIIGALALFLVVPAPTSAVAEPNLWAQEQDWSQRPARDARSATRQVHLGTDGIPVGPRAWRTRERFTHALPRVPLTADTLEEVEVHVFLRERVVAVYEHGVLREVMPTVPGSREDPSTALIGKTLVVSDRYQDYWSHKLYLVNGAMRRAWMPYAQRLSVVNDDGTQNGTGYFFHKGDMRPWKSRSLGSHGCFRLTWQDAIWLWEFLKPGDRVVVMASTESVLW